MAFALPVNQSGERSTDLDDASVHIITVAGDDTRRDGCGPTINLAQSIDADLVELRAIRDRRLRYHIEPSKSSIYAAA